MKNFTLVILLLGQLVFLACDTNETIYTTYEAAETSIALKFPAETAELPEEFTIEVKVTTMIDDTLRGDSYSDQIRVINGQGVRGIEIPSETICDIEVRFTVDSISYIGYLNAYGPLAPGASSAAEIALDIVREESWSISFDPDNPSGAGNFELTIRDSQVVAEGNWSLSIEGRNYSGTFFAPSVTTEGELYINGSGMANSSGESATCYFQIGGSVIDQAVIDGFYSVFFQDAPQDWPFEQFGSWNGELTGGGGITSP
jgi:hypothetical protein